MQNVKIDKIVKIVKIFEIVKIVIIVKMVKMVKLSQINFDSRNTLGEYYSSCMPKIIFIG